MAKGNIPKYSGKAERVLADGTTETWYVTLWDYIPRQKTEEGKKE